MQYYQAKRVTLIALLVTAILTFAPVVAKAEVVTLNCFGDGSIEIIDLSAGTAIHIYNNIRNNMTDVKISDSTISYVWDIPDAWRFSFQIDRTTGRNVQTLIYTYPGNNAPTNSGRSGQCTKIPNKVI